MRPVLFTGDWSFRALPDTSPRSSSPIRPRSVFYQWFHLSSIDYVNSYETKLMLVNVDRGIGFVPNFVNTDRHPDVVSRELTPLYRLRKYYAIIKKNNITPYAHQLVRILEDYYQPKLWMRELGI